MTVFGDPNKFALVVEQVQSWNDRDASKNGIFHFIVDRRIFPDKARVATISAELGCLSAGNALIDFPENSAIASLGAPAAFERLLNGMLPYLLMNEDDIPEDFETDYTYQASTGNLEDEGCFAFAVGVGDQVRILAAQLERTGTAEARRVRDVSEVWIKKEELTEIIVQAKSCYGECQGNGTQS